jgi:hypothetical protein
MANWSGAPSAYLGIDPGDRWVGLAILQQRGGRGKQKNGFTSWYGQSIVLDTEGKSILQVIKLLEPYVAEAEMIVAEDYDQRPQKFNAFNSGRTLRLLGAIEVAVKMRGDVRFRLVAPGNPKDAAKMWRGDVALGDLFLLNGQARHAASAWRALGAYLMQKRPKLLAEFTGATR